MLHKTRGIVLSTLSYSDTSVIAHVYTEQFGPQSYMINGARGKRAKIKANLLQPLSLIEMVVYHKEKSSLQRIREIRNSQPFTSIPYNILKTSIVIFINEVLYKAIREEEPNQRLFEFIYSSVQILDLEQENCANFHLSFLVQLSKYLGFLPQGKAGAETPYFDLQEGTFISQEPLHPYFLDQNLSSILEKLAEFDYTAAASIMLTNDQRRELLSKLILYYELHLPGLREINSHKILEEVIS